MKEFKVTIEGITPYMQHRMDDVALELNEKNRQFIVENKNVNEEDFKKALARSYFDDKGYYIPAEHMQGALINAGSFLKSKVGNAKKSMKNIVAAMFSLKEPKLYLPDTFTIDKRSAVNKAIKGRVITVRPKWEQWDATFTLRVDNDTITKETITELVTAAGNYVGIGSFRPTNNGMFGRFSVKSIVAK